MPNAEVIEIKRYTEVRDRWMDKDLLAGHWNCSRRTIDNYLTEGLPMVMRGGKRQVMLSVAEQWAADYQREKGAA